ncbi:MAG: ABC transporter substrate-binding protein [Candidatus Lambdaproteobacteria bacterium]|nr:ABC transporter substrate-binding protein [Candidatus Lambdaproteobacteria bacterium]
MHSNKWSLSVAALALLALVAGSTPALAQKYGGVLRWGIRGSPAELSIHETALSGVTSIAVPIYSNLVWFDSLKARESIETIVPDVATSWFWSADGKALTFKLRKGVTWHDGKPFSAADVQHTWSVVRGAKQGGLKLNPRKLWFENVAQIDTRGDHEVTFRLKRPQPSLLAMFAAGYQPVYPAHVSPAALRTTAMGTGPFRMKRYERDQTFESVKNPNYFKKGRPYLDGILYVIFKSAAPEQGALLARQIDAMAILATPGPVHENLKATNKQLAYAERITNATINLVYNPKKPPMDNPKIRHAINLALDRDGLIKSVFQGGAVMGTAFIPAPTGIWGMTPEQMAKFPAYRDSATNKAESRKILAELGYSESNPLRLKFTIRNVVSSSQSANWAVGELKQVGIAAEIQLIDTGNWYGVVARREFAVAINETAIAVDDPDAGLHENYGCGSQRNYTDFCNRALEKKFDEQSAETDFATRHKLVQAIDAQLTLLEARPYIVYRKDYYAHYPYVKNWVPHTSIYNGWKLEDVWLDK